MINKLKSLLILAILSIALSACVGPPSDDKCIPSDGSKSATATSSPGKTSGSMAEKVDRFIKEGKIITTIVTDIKGKLLGTNGSYSSSQGIFEGFINSVDYQMAVAATFTLFLIFYGVGIVSGIVQISLNDAVLRLIKIGFISIIALNWYNFYGLIGTFFVDGTDELIAYFIDNFDSLYNISGTTSLPAADLTSQIFSKYDDLIARIFSFQTFAFISALLNMEAAGPYSPVYAILLGLGMWWVLQSIFKVVSVYVFSLFGKALLFALAPIFLLFLLFNQTKSLFDGWLKQLISFSLQPILITAYIGLFINLLIPFFDEFAQYKLCWNKLDNTTNKYGWTFVDPDSSTNDPVEFGATSIPPISLQAVLLFGFFSWLFISALKMTDNIVISIAGSFGTTLSGVASYENMKSMGAKGANFGKNDLTLAKDLH